MHTPPRRDCALCAGSAAPCSFCESPKLPARFADLARRPGTTVALYIPADLWRRNAEELVTRAELAAELVRLPLGRREGGPLW